jgi:hypothetical protein
LKFGRDSAWPLKLTVASALDETTIHHLRLWLRRLWRRFHDAASEDQIPVPPAFTRSGSVWDLSLRNENNLLHILTRENPADGTFPFIPEGPRLPVAILYGPNAIVKLRKQTPIAAQVWPTFGECIDKLYQRQLKVTEQLRTSELAIAGSLGNDSLSGVIPADYRLHTA